MLFNSYSFFVFLPIVFAGYWLLARRRMWQNLFVVVASYFFYGYWDWRFPTCAVDLQYDRKAVTSQ